MFPSLEIKCSYRSFFTTDLKNWIRLNLNYCGVGNEGWRNVGITSCHALWYWRNLEIHDEQYERPFDPVCHILRRIQDYKQATYTFKKINGVADVNLLMVVEASNNEYDEA